MQAKMALHCLKRRIRLGYIARLLVVYQNIVTEKVIVDPLRKAKVAVVLSPVEPPKLFYRVGIARADCNDARDRMRKCFVGYQGHAG
jgi:hypothetical protein